MAWHDDSNWSGCISLLVIDFLQIRGAFVKCPRVNAWKLARQSGNFNICSRISCVCRGGGLTLGAESSWLGMQRIVWHRGSNRRFSVQSHCLDPKRSPEFILGFPCLAGEGVRLRSRWAVASSPCQIHHKRLLLRKDILNLGKKKKKGKRGPWAQVKKQVAVLQDYQTPINNPGLINFLTADKSHMGSCSYQLLAVTTVRAQSGWGETSYFQFTWRTLLPSLLTTTQCSKPQTHSELLSVPSALKPKANCTISTHILKSSLKYFNIYFFPPSGAYFKA